MALFGLKSLAEKIGVKGFIKAGEEVASRATHLHPNLKLVGESFETSHLKTLTRRLEAFATEHPRAMSRLGDVTVVDSENIKWKQILTSHNPRWSGLAVDYDEGTGIFLDARSMGRFGIPAPPPPGVSPTEWNKHLETAPWLGNAPDQTWSVPVRASTTDDYFDRILTHELGHHLHYQAERAGYRTLGWVGHTMGKHPTQLNSEYALSNPFEFVAEAYTASIHEPRLMNEELTKMIGWMGTAAERVPENTTEIADVAAGRILRSGPRRAITPDRSLNQNMFGRRHSSARSGLAVRSSATGRFR